MIRTLSNSKEYHQVQMSLTPVTGAAWSIYDQLRGIGGQGGDEEMYLKLNQISSNLHQVF